MHESTKIEAERLRRKIQLETGLRVEMQDGKDGNHVTFCLRSMFDWNLQAINDEFFEGCGEIKRDGEKYLLTACRKIIY